MMGHKLSSEDLHRGRRDKLDDDGETVGRKRSRSMSYLTEEQKQQLLADAAKSPTSHTSSNPFSKVIGTLPEIEA